MPFLSLVPCAPLWCVMAETGESGETRETSAPPADLLCFAPWQSAVDEGFWHRLANFKLNTQRLEEHPVPITGFFAPCGHPKLPSRMQLLSESMPAESGDLEEVSWNRNRCPAPGTLYNANSLENFKALDRKALLEGAARQIWDDIRSGRAEESSNLLNRFLVISFADLKKWIFYYWFAFPAIGLPTSATVSSVKTASEFWSSDQAAGFLSACKSWRESKSDSCSPFFLLHKSHDDSVTARPLGEWRTLKQAGGEIVCAFYDPYYSNKNPGWPLRNFLALAVRLWQVSDLQVLCYRETRGQPDFQHSLVLNVILPKIPEWENLNLETGGWEMSSRTKKYGPQIVDLGAILDPVRLASSTADLNLKLMRWRLLPSLNLERLSSTKCLILGAGTLGCQVARGLMAWGVKHITLVDSGRVAMSNPLRQSLYALEDCLNGGKPKAEAAAVNLKRIFPGVEARGVQMTIPMPGHSVSQQEEAHVKEQCRQLKHLVDEHDIVFLLTDTRESRWLPTLLCAEGNKIAINAALGFDTFLVMRHGTGPMSGQQDGSLPRTRLGCYFCNDVVAPQDSMAQRTLDQQCTVTRPGLAPMAAALAVELAVNILHHPDGNSAPADPATPITASTDEPLGILPHQVRGFVAHFAQLVVTGHAFDKCTACSSMVVEEFRKRETDFILDVLNYPTYLEDITGITELVAATAALNVDWDEE